MTKVGGNKLLQSTQSEMNICGVLLFRIADAESALGGYRQGQVLVEVFVQHIVVISNEWLNVVEADVLKLRKVTKGASDGALCPVTSQ